MRVRDHIALSTAGAALLSPLLGRRVLGPWAGSIVVDVDHYVWFALRHGRWSPRAAVRFFNEAEPPHDPATRVLHQPSTLLALALLAARWRGARAVVLGMALHVALDACHERLMDNARATALERDRFVCQRCGARGPRLSTHLQRQPRLLPSYESWYHVTLCSTCHDLAHRRGTYLVPGNGRPSLVRA
jgi:hypothetical protein